MLFEPGKKIISRAIGDNLAREAIQMLFNRHLNGDWGDISESDKKRNDDALLYGGRIFSGYFTGYGKIYIITEDNRSASRILFADEYRRS